jgi:hypothetical protein
MSLVVNGLNIFLFLNLSLSFHSKSTLAQHLTSEHAKDLTFGQESNLFVSGETLFKVTLPKEDCTYQPIIIAIQTSLLVSCYNCCCCCCCCCCHCCCYFSCHCCRFLKRTLSCNETWNASK